MAETWVSNASPLILLDRIGELRLLTEQCDELVIPQGVVGELTYHPSETAKWDGFARGTRGVRVVSVAKIPAVISGWNLGQGEAEVVAWAASHGRSVALLDDLDARKCAQTLGVPVRGTIGVILLAKQNGLIPQARPMVQALVQAGLRFDNSWVAGALALVGERWTVL